jgi:hypothetical protein
METNNIKSLKDGAAGGIQTRYLEEKLVDKNSQLN